VLFALGQPAAFAGLLIAFLLALAVRAVAIRLTARVTGLTPRRESLTPRPREDVDPFGAVAAALGGTGWGRVIEVDELPRHRGRGRAAAVLAAGALSAIVASQIAFAGYAALFPATGALELYRPSDVLRGAVDATVLAQFLLSLAAGLLCFGLLALIPIPPMDGFGLLWTAFRRPGPALLWMRLWFGEKNIGVAVLLLFLLFPSGYPLVHVLLDAVGTPLLRVWS
jgi:Zn-dependent protease